MTPLSAEREDLSLSGNAQFSHLFLLSPDSHSPKLKLIGKNCAIDSIAQLIHVFILFRLHSLDINSYLYLYSYSIYFFYI